MIALDSAAVFRLLSMKECIPLMKETMRAVSAGQTEQMLRQIMPVPGGIYGVMGGVVPETFGAKLIAAVKPEGTAVVPSHQGVVVLFSAQNGVPVALVDATSLTAIRTAAASAMATQELARDNSTELAILGTGEQALMHARAICLIRPIRSIRIWGRDEIRAAALAERLEQELAVELCVAPTIGQAVGNADIVCTVTAAAEPFLGAEDIAAGAHVNAVGSSHLGQCEIGNDLVAAAKFFGDSRESVISQGAEFLNARAAGLISDEHFAGEIGQLVAKHCQGRESDEEITLYKSLGHIAQDLAAAWSVYRAALEIDEGQKIAL